MSHVDRIIQFEAGELDETETVELFQALVNDGTAWQLQGSYGRTAHALIEAGLVTEPQPEETSQHVLTDRFCTARDGSVEWTTGPTCPVCRAPADFQCLTLRLETGRVCTAEHGHDGDHVAHGPGGRVVETWARAATDRTAMEHETETA